MSALAHLTTPLGTLPHPPPLPPLPTLHPCPLSSTVESQHPAATLSIRASNSFIDLTNNLKAWPAKLACMHRTHGDAQPCQLPSLLVLSVMTTPQPCLWTWISSLQPSSIFSTMLGTQVSCTSDSYIDCTQSRSGQLLAFASIATCAGPISAYRRRTQNALWGAKAVCTDSKHLSCKQHTHLLPDSCKHSVSSPFCTLVAAGTT